MGREDGLSRENVPFRDRLSSLRINETWDFDPALLTLSPWRSFMYS